MEENKVAKITIDRGLCIGAGSCLSAEGVYELDEENKAVMLLKGDVKTSEASNRTDLANEGVTDDALVASAQACPTMAILLHDANGEQIYP
jgi:ferredoxin